MRRESAGTSVKTGLLAQLVQAGLAPRSPRPSPQALLQRRRLPRVCEVDRDAQIELPPQSVHVAVASGDYRNVVTPPSRAPAPSQGPRPSVPAPPEIAGLLTLFHRRDGGLGHIVIVLSARRSEEWRKIEMRDCLPVSGEGREKLRRRRGGHGKGHVKTRSSAASQSVIHHTSLASRLGLRPRPHLAQRPKRRRLCRRCASWTPSRHRTSPVRGGLSDGVRAPQDAAGSSVARWTTAPGQGAAGALRATRASCPRERRRPTPSLSRPSARRRLVRAERRQRRRAGGVACVLCFLSCLVEVPRQHEGARARDLDGREMRLRPRATRALRERLAPRRQQVVVRREGMVRRRARWSSASRERHGGLRRLEHGRLVPHRVVAALPRPPQRGRRGRRPCAAPRHLMLAPPPPPPRRTPRAAALKQRAGRATTSPRRAPRARRRKRLVGFLR